MEEGTGNCGNSVEEGTGKLSEISGFELESNSGIVVLYCQLISGVGRNGKVKIVVEFCDSAVEH